MDLRLEGVDQLKAAFEQIKLDMGTALAAGLIAGTMLVLNATKQKAPVVSGDLMRSYFVTTPDGLVIVPPEEKGATGVADLPTISLPVTGSPLKDLAAKMNSTGRGETMVASNLIYAPIQEFRYTPHLRPALDENARNVNAEAQKAIKWAIITASRKAGRI